MIQKETTSKFKHDVFSDSPEVFPIHGKEQKDKVENLKYVCRDLDYIGEKIKKELHDCYIKKHQELKMCKQMKDRRNGIIEKVQQEELSKQQAHDKDGLAKYFNHMCQGWDNGMDHKALTESNVEKDICEALFNILKSKGHTKYLCDDYVEQIEKSNEMKEDIDINDLKKEYIAVKEKGVDESEIGKLWKHTAKAENFISLK